MPALSSANSFTTPTLRQGDTGFDVVVSGTFSGTITVQISKDQSTWSDIETTTTTGVLTGKLGTAWYVRAGFKTGNYTSGTANVEVY